MRRLVYNVTREGIPFTTFSHSVAHESGVTIHGVELVNIDERTRKEKEWNREHAKKVWEKRWGRG